MQITVHKLYVCVQYNCNLVLMSVDALAGCGGWSGPSPICRAHSHYADRVTVCGCQLCQEAVWSEHHPQWRVHGECLASLLQRYQDWQDPGAQVQLTVLFHISHLLLLNESITLCLNGCVQLDLCWHFTGHIFRQKLIPVMHTDAPTQSFQHQICISTLVCMWAISAETAV